ncbi:peptide chain release factor subunit 1 [Acrasis kona]|uniref:Peptide chain release factor subunit 1 n=1 Tax=Acrasis kona TaxID=1008807 RepID=A0AAW2YKH5_9EUKA
MSTVISRLKLFRTTPTNGLAVFCGLVNDDNDQGRKKMKKVIVVVEPIYSIKHDLYHCDSKFHVEPLLDQLEEHTRGDSYGFIILTGSGTLYATIQGDTPKILHSFSEELPKKHNKGGQSQSRFARNRQIAIKHYLSQIGEKATKNFIDEGTNLPAVKGIFIAGAANLKDEFFNGNYLDERIKKITLKVITVCYGGEIGLREAVEQVAPILQNVKHLQEKKIVCEFMDHVCNNENLAVFGVNHVVQALEAGVVKTLVVNENVDALRATFTDCDGGLTTHFMSRSEFDKRLQGGSNLVEQTPALEWIVEQYQKKVYTNVELSIVSDKTSEGSQLLNGFGGMGAILRYKMTFEDECFYQSDSEDDLSDFI